MLGGTAAAYHVLKVDLKDARFLGGRPVLLVPLPSLEVGEEP